MCRFAAAVALVVGVASFVPARAARAADDFDRVGSLFPEQKLPIYRGGYVRPNFAADLHVVAQMKAHLRRYGLSSDRLLMALTARLEERVAAGYFHFAFGTLSSSIGQARVMGYDGLSVRYGAGPATQADAILLHPVAVVSEATHLQARPGTSATAATLRRSALERVVFGTLFHEAGHMFWPRSATIRGALTQAEEMFAQYVGFRAEGYAVAEARTLALTEMREPFYRTLPGDIGGWDTTFRARRPTVVRGALAGAVPSVRPPAILPRQAVQFGRSLGLGGKDLKALVRLLLRRG